jgi:hypothetical protein
MRGSRNAKARRAGCRRMRIILRRAMVRRGGGCHKELAEMQRPQTTIRMNWFSAVVDSRIEGSGMRIRMFFVSVVLVLMAPFAVAQQKSEMRTATVCAIARAPARFNRLLVRIPAHIESDSFEHTDLVDRACESAGISLDSSAQFKGQDELEKAIHSPWPGTIDKDISGVFIGKFEWRPAEREKLILVLRGFEKLKVTKK